MAIRVPNMCPCGGRGADGKLLTYKLCCGRYLDRGEIAPDAEQLMRSRYTAFALGRVSYLRLSWHPSTCPADPGPVANTVWLGLEIKNHKVVDDTHQEVEFVARYRAAGKPVRLHEHSRFLLDEGRWRYVDGDLDSQIP